jgi:hypothetical protein
MRSDIGREPRAQSERDSEALDVSDDKTASAEIMGRCIALDNWVL